MGLRPARARPPVLRWLCIAAASLAPFSAAAQTAVTTFGSTDASKCYENAENALSRDIAPCDRALGDRTAPRADRMKTFVNRGIIHNRNGAPQIAIDDFNAALAIDPNLPEAYLNRGNSYFLIGLHDDALADYEQALALDVKEPWSAHYNMGLVHDVKKQPDKAREAYQKAVEAKPDFVAAQRKLEGRS